MTSAPNGNGYGRYSFYASAAIVLFTVIGAIIWIGGIANEVAQNKGYIEAQSTKIIALEHDLRSNDLLTSNLQRDQRESETQFCANDIVRNLMHANELRTTSLLWQKVFGVPYPTDNAYYPTICHKPTD